MRPILAVGLAGTLLLAVAPALAGCDADRAPADSSGSGSPTAPDSAAHLAREELAGHAAAAKDLRYSALYTLSTPDRADRTVVVTRATDGSWRVDIPAGAQGGTADVSVARTRDGLYQCALASAERAIQPYCVRAAGPSGRLSSDVDPRVQHIFVDWLDVLTDRDAALAVFAANAPAGMRGPCYAVESNSVSVAIPLEVGIYCFGRDGTLNGARLGLGTLTLTGAPAPAPPTITLPGPVVPGAPLSMASPPPPPTTPAGTTPTPGG